MRHLTLTVQDTVGALDRVLGALTHRGIVPRHLQVTHQPNGTLGQGELMVVCQFFFDDETAYTKLVKALEKQVTVIAVQQGVPA